MANISNTSIIDPFYVHVTPTTTLSASIFVGLSFMMGIPGNTLVVLVHTKIREKTVTDWMIFYIAVCDIMSLINAPLYIMQFTRIWTLGLPDFLCKFHYYNLNSVSMASYIFCAVTAVERFYKVVHSKQIISTKQAKILSIPILIISYGLGSITLIVVANNENGHCMYDLTSNLPRLQYIFLLAIALLSSIVMTYCYIRMGIYLMRKMKEMKLSGNNECFCKSNKTMIQTTKMLAIVTVVFLVSANVPYITGIFFTTRTPDNDTLMTITMFLGLSFFVNNFFNPLLYLGMSRVFRSRVLQFCCCRPVKYMSSTSHSVPNTLSTEVA